MWYYHSISTRLLFVFFVLGTLTPLFVTARPNPKLESITGSFNSLSLVAVASPVTPTHSPLQEAGIPEKDWVFADYIVMHEGHYDPCVVNGGAHDCNYSGSKAYGVCQAKPGNKMASMGNDWRTNIVTQLKWCHQYALVSHGKTWQNNYNFWLQNKWW